MLSHRLTAIAGMVTRGNTLADIGTDHGYLPIELVSSGVCPRAIAMDINEGPLERAKEHVAMSGLSECIELRLSNGLEYLQIGEAQSVVIAGMGGHLITGILEAGHEVAATMQEIIISPQSDIRLVRESLRQMGFVIVDEELVAEDGKFYPIIKIRYSNELIDELDNQEMLDIYGPVLIAKKHSTLKEFLIKEHASKEQILRNLERSGSNSSSRRAEIEHLLALNEMAMSALK